MVAQPEGGRGVWAVPGGRPTVGFRPRRQDPQLEIEQWAEVVAWATARNPPREFQISCVRLENIVEGLIWGGRAFAIDVPDDGLPELRHLRGAVIDAFITRAPLGGQAAQRGVHVAATGPQFFLGHDREWLALETGEEQEEPPRRIRSIGPAQSGYPADLIVKVDRTWVEMVGQDEMASRRERETRILDGLLSGMIRENLYAPFKVGMPDITINSGTIAIAGPAVGAAVAAIASAQRHVQMGFDEFANLPQAERVGRLRSAFRSDEIALLLSTYARERGLDFRRRSDGAIVDVDGNVVAAEGGDR